MQIILYFIAALTTLIVFTTQNCMNISNLIPPALTLAPFGADIMKVQVKHRNRILTNENKHEYSDQIGNKLFNLYHHTPTFGHIFMFDAIPVSENMSLKDIYIDPKKKLVYQVMMDKDNQRSGFQINSDGSIHITDQKIMSVPEQGNSIHENQMSKYLTGWLKASVVNGQEHALSINWKHSTECQFCKYRVYGIDEIKKYNETTTSLNINQNELRPNNKNKAEHYAYGLKHENVIIGYIVNEDSTSSLYQFFFFALCDQFDDWSECEGIFIMPHYEQLNHHGVLILQNKGNGVIDIHMMRQDKHYMFYSVRGDIDNMNGDKDTIKYKKSDKDNWMDVLLYICKTFSIKTYSNGFDRSIGDSFLYQNHNTNCTFDKTKT